MTQKDNQIKNDLMRAYSLVVEHKRRADSLGKNLVLIIGERHTSRFALGIELMVEFAFHDLGISRAGCETTEAYLDAGKQMAEEFFLEIFPGFGDFKGNQKRKIIKDLPKIFVGKPGSNSNFLRHLQFLNGTQTNAFDPLYKHYSEGQIVNVAHADFIKREEAMVEKLTALASKGHLYIVAGCGHIPILVPELRKIDSLLVASIYCAELRSSTVTEGDRLEKAQSLATWIPSILHRPETFTASQMMEFALEVLHDARKKHNLFPGSTKLSTAPNPP